ncbi:MAG TPA: 2Fe-2S iron-sulfur cluster-binding protein, partial [Candidatus Limnocylindrales bacterium]
MTADWKALASTPASPIVINPPARPTNIPEAPYEAPPAAVTVTIDGHEVTVPQGSTILEACRAQGLDIP